MTERNPFGPVRPKGRGRWWLLAAGGVAVVAAVSLVLTLISTPHPDAPCAPCVSGRRAMGGRHRRLVHVRPRAAHG